MLNRNEYFEEMKRITEEYKNTKRAHEEKKKEIINTFGWDSNELKNWYEEHDKMTYPIESGAAKAYRAFQYSLVNGNEEFEMEDFLWDREVEDFVDTLRKAGIKTFVYTNQSTAVMENLHGFETAGCKMEGLCKIERKVKHFGTEKTEEILGIRFIVPVIEEENNTEENNNKEKISIDVMRCKLVKEKEIEYMSITDSSNAARLFRALEIDVASEEIFVIACLDTSGNVTGIHEVSRGIVNSSLVHPREVFKRALLNNASGIICCHNHPSGSLNPSKEDIQLTERLVGVGKLIGIPILDHIIVTPNGQYFSVMQGII